MRASIGCSVGFETRPKSVRMFSEMRADVSISGALMRLLGGSWLCLRGHFPFSAAVSLRESILVLGAEKWRSDKEEFCRP